MLLLYNQWRWGINELVLFLSQAFVCLSCHLSFVFLLDCSAIRNLGEVALSMLWDFRNFSFTISSSSDLTCRELQTVKLVCLFYLLKMMLQLPCDKGTDGFDPHIPPDDKESLGSVHAMVNHAEEQLGWIIQHQVKELLAGPMLTLLPSHRKTVPVRGKVGPNTTNIPPLTSYHLSTPGP